MKRIMPNHSRRTFVLAMAQFLPAALLLPGEALPQAIAAVGGQPLRKGQANLDPYKDGKLDATAAIQAVIDESTEAGSVAAIPPGKYWVNPDKGIYLRSNTRLALDQGAQLIAQPSNNGRYGIIRIYDAKNVSLSGGTIVGERHAHLGQGGEWGMGIDIGGSSDVTVSNVIVKDCWGDGIYLGTGHSSPSPCRNIHLQNVTAIGNRRQGLSIVACIGANVLDSKFLSTAGTPPACGIDLEPNGDNPVSNVLIRHCDVEGNAGSGIQTWNHASDVTITECTIINNHTHGILLGGVTSRVEIVNNKIMNNDKYDIYVGKDASQYALTNNTLSPSRKSFLLPSRQAIFVQH
jgi:polygalacturonase